MILSRYIKKCALRLIAQLLNSGHRRNMSDVLAFFLLFYLDLTHKKNPFKTHFRKKELVNFVDNLVGKVLQDDSCQEKPSGSTRNQQFSQQNDRHLIFLDCHIEDSLTSNIIKNLFESAKKYSAISTTYLNLSSVSVSERIQILKSTFNDLNKQYYVFFEIHVGMGDSEKTLNPRMFSELINSDDIKLVPIVFDLYRPFDKSFVDLWSPNSTAILHLDPVSARKFQANVKMIFWPFVFTTQEISTGKKLENHQNSLRNVILFQGSINSQSRLRYLLLLSNLSKRLKIEIRIIQSNMHSLRDISERQARYYQELTNALAVINFNEKQNSSHSVITFRSIETMSLGGCLLEQQNSQLNSQLTNLAVPFQHYLPFETPRDLVLLCWALSRNPEIAERIKTNTRKHWKNNYSEVQLWDQLIDSLESLNFI